SLLAAPAPRSRLGVCVWCLVSQRCRPASSASVACLDQGRGAHRDLRSFPYTTLFRSRRRRSARRRGEKRARTGQAGHRGRRPSPDRKSTRLNSSHVSISYAVFCLKKKKRGRGRGHVTVGGQHGGEALHD